MDENPYEPGMYSSQLDRINEGRSFPKATYLESSRVRALTQNNIIQTSCSSHQKDHVSQDNLVTSYLFPHYTVLLTIFTQVSGTEQTSLVDQMVKNLPAMQETWVQSLGCKDPLEKGTATVSSILAWRIPWTVQSMGSQRLGHGGVTFTFILHIK